MRRRTITLLKDQYTFFIISCLMLLRIRNISNTNFRENRNTILCPATFYFFRKSCRLWGN